MSTFASPATKANVKQRIERLTPDAARQWGRMTPHQMVCHLADGYRMSANERNPHPAHNFFSRSFMRWIALHTSMAWPKGVKTLPEVDQERNGTKPVEWDRDLAELARMVDSFKPIEGHAHPFFGPLTTTEWNVWAYRHADHHLRQFSA